MKKIISLMLCLLLIFSSVNFVFADFSTTDSSNLQSIRNTLINTTGGTIYYMISQINGAMRFSNKTIANWLSDIYGTVDNTLWASDGNTERGIAWWVKEAVLDLDTLVGTGSGSLLSYVQNIDSNVNTVLTRVNSILTNMGHIDSTLAFIQGDTGNIVTTLDNVYNDSHKLSGTALGSAEFFSPLGTMQPWSFSYYSSDDLISRYSRAFSQTFARMYAAQHQGLGSNMGSFNLYSQYANAFSQNYVSTDDILIKSFSNISQTLGTITAGYLNTTKIVNWKTLAESSPVSTGVASMVENYLEAIQNPIARLAYVHASDEEIAAREKAEANQTAVVNNFIDSSGSGAAPASSFSNIASMSSGYTSNMNTDAQASGIWNIFDSNNFGWFSQETANQLDTTVSTRKGSSKFDTPLLDQQISDIYKSLGVDVND